MRISAPSPNPPDVVLPESTKRAVSPAVMHESAVKSTIVFSSDVVVDLKSVDWLEIIRCCANRVRGTSEVTKVEDASHAQPENAV